ncbi:MAG: hypothetical protein OEY67_10475 [Gammaproteobacteria bacterium]|nr:hypothetical protein [Gammaproteobacteria bacterium]
MNIYACVLMAVVNTVSVVQVYADEFMPPEIRYRPSNALIEPNKSVSLTVQVEGRGGSVKDVLLYYRQRGALDYNITKFKLHLKQESLYTVTLGPESVQVPGIEYFIVVEDVFGNVASRGVSFSPMVMVVYDSGSEKVLQKSNSLGKHTEIIAIRESAKSSDGFARYRWIVITAGILATGFVYAQNL